jgi:hypothetical protein
MSIIDKIDEILNEQLNSKDFDTLSAVFNDGDEFGIDAAISILRDKIKDEMETIVAIAPKYAMGNIDTVKARNLNPLMKALDMLEKDSLNKAKFKKAGRLFDEFIKKTRSLI